MLESALTDIKEAPPGVLASLTQQALWLLRLLQDFLCAEGHGNQELWSEKVWQLRAEALCSHAPRVPGLQSGLVHMCSHGELRSGICEQVYLYVQMLSGPQPKPYLPLSSWASGLIW